VAVVSAGVGESEVVRVGAGVGAASVGAGVGTGVGTVPGSTMAHVGSRHEQSMSEVSETGVLQDAAA